MPEITEILLSQSGVGETDGGWIVYVGNADTDPPRLRLTVADRRSGERHEHWAGLGDTFPIGEQTWRFADIRFTGPYQFIADLRYVAAGAPPFTPPPATGERSWRRLELHPQGGTDEAAVAAFERELGRALPPVYRAWLIETNGVTPSRLCQVPGTRVIIDPVHPTLGIRPDERLFDLRFGVLTAKGFFSDDFVVVATTATGVIAVRSSPPLDVVVSLDHIMETYVDDFASAGYASPEEYVAAELIVECAADIRRFLAGLEALSG